jgi:phage shock protein A
MALIRRVSRLFTADMHAVLDQIEEPEIVLRQAIREMEEELARQRQREKWLGEEIRGTARRLEGFAASIGEIDSNLDLCFANGNEPLARKLTRRKLETQKLREQTAARREALEKQQGEIAALIADNADQLDGMRQKAAVLAAEAPAADGSGRYGPTGVDEDDVEVAFLREKQARTPA